MSDTQKRSPMVDPRQGSTTDRIWIGGVVLWASVLICTWPAALSFGDEVGYVGQIRTVLQGRLRPLPQDPGVWVAGVHGLVAKYPYFPSLLMAPLFALHPRLIFVLGPLAALGLVFVASRVLKAWDQNPAWALIVLMHPTITILARTAMTDVIFAASLVGAWWAIRRERRGCAVLLVALTVAIKAIGFVLVGALLAGEIVRQWNELRARQRVVLLHLSAPIIGLAIGMAVTVTLNLGANGTLWFGYADAFRHIAAPPFSLTYLRTTAPVHLRSLLAVPPLLVAGLWPYWRRREYGPLFASGAIVTMMCAYFFVDQGRSLVETLVLSPRLILPAVAFLLVGYADLIAILARRVSRDSRWTVVLAFIPALIALPISIRHERWQAPEAAALAAASAAAGNDQIIGLNGASTKTGLLYKGRTVAIESGSRPRVILCNTQYPSYRAPTDLGGSSTCAFPGYRDLLEEGTLHVLRQNDP